MRPYLFALLTALAWGVGGYFEKKGLHLGHFAPRLGITVRTAVALLVLGTVSYPQWKTLPQGGIKAISLLVVGGGLIAGSLGMLSFYIAIKGAPLSRVMPIAFTAPLFGALLGMIFGGEPVTMQTIAGTVLTVGGIIVLTMG